MIVHARGKTIFNIILIHIRGHRDDGQFPPALRLQTADAPGRFKAVHFRHLQIHEDQIVGVRIRRDHIKRFPPVFSLVDDKSRAVQ